MTDEHVQPEDQLPEEQPTAQGGQSNDEVARLVQELEDMKNIAARAQADLHNARKRMEREKEDFVKFANQKMAMAMLPVLDTMERGMLHFTAEQKESDLGKGMQAVIQQFVSALESVGVHRIDAQIGTHYDHHRHEAVMQGDGAQDTILEVLEAGYEMSGRVLRPAKVKVGAGA